LESGPRLIANIVHTSLNPRGGSERLAVAVMQALSEMGFDIEFTTFEQPDFSRLETAYGKSAVSVLRKIKKVHLLQSLDYPEITDQYDLIINTHGDMLPFFLPWFTKKNAVTYCHFPLAKYLMDSKDPEYIRFLNSTILYNVSRGNVSKKYLNLAQNAYTHMLRNSTILSNSEFTSRVISKAFGLESTVLSPPVDVDFFRKDAFLSSLSHNHEKNDIILVISRFHPSKKIENAIKIAYLLKQCKVGKAMNIVGNVPPQSQGYFFYLKQMVEYYGLTDYVRFEINVNFNKLLQLMKEAKVYFHTLPGEPFGISTVEAMSSGLIPVVPDIGGHTEFVPLKYQFHTFREGVKVVSNALNAPSSERILISNSVKKYSVRNFIQRFQVIIRNQNLTKIRV
jgi:glycosyltransferase involved in cell wall biosynthesis